MTSCWPSCRILERPASRRRRFVMGWWRHSEALTAADGELRPRQFKSCFCIWKASWRATIYRDNLDGCVEMKLALPHVFCIEMRAWDRPWCKSTDCNGLSFLDDSIDRWCTHTLFLFYCKAQSVFKTHSMRNTIKPHAKANSTRLLWRF